jgi:MFS transporter, PAT family, beta-lactamase induction signal transducer AmpG
MTTERDATVRTPHTSVFLPLIFPFGVSTGYVTVTLAYILAQRGMPVAAVGAVIALSTLPQTWKVLWAPLVDTTLSPKRWYLIGALAVGLTILAMSLIQSPASAMPLLSGLVMVSSIASTLCSMSTETFMANLGGRQQGRASGWSQAGNFAGTGVGGGLALYLAQHVHAQWVSGAVTAAVCLACALPLLLIDEPERHGRPTLRETFGEVIRDVWSVASKRSGILVIFLMLLPIGSGMMLWNSTAPEWKVSAELVALTGGVINGVISGLAALAGGYVCDLMDRRLAYCLFGALVAPVLVLTVFLPRTPEVWVIASLTYQALVAACYSAYSAVTLEVIGGGAAATKFNLMASAGNVPITIMPLVDGTLHDRYGTAAMFYGEAALSVAAALLFGLVVLVWRPKKTQAA